MTLSAKTMHDPVQDEQFRLHHIALASKGLSHPKRWNEEQLVDVMKAISTDDLTHRHPHWAGITVKNDEDGLSMHVLMDRTLFTLTQDGLRKDASVGDAEWTDLSGALLRWLDTQSAAPVPTGTLKAYTKLYANLVSSVVKHAPVSEGSMPYGHQWVMETIANRLLAPSPLASSEHPERLHAAVFNEVMISKGVIPYYPLMEKSALDLTREALLAIDSANQDVPIDRFALGVWIQNSV